MTHKELEALLGRKIDTKLVLVYDGDRVFSRVQTSPLWVQLDEPRPS